MIAVLIQQAAVGDPNQEFWGAAAGLSGAFLVGAAVLVGNMIRSEPADSTSNVPAILLLLGVGLPTAGALAALQSLAVRRSLDSWHQAAYFFGIILEAFVLVAIGVRTGRDQSP